MITAFCELLKFCLSNNSFSYTLSEEEWKEILLLSKKHTLTGVIFEGVKRLPKEQQPPRKILLQWFTDTEKIKERNKELNQLVVKVSSRFAKDGFRSVILKGQGNASYYPNPLVRTPGDIDIWLDGNRKDIVKYVRRYCQEEIVYHHAEFPILKNCNIEVHFTPSWMNNFFKNKKLQKLFSNLKEEQFQHLTSLPDTRGEICIPTIEFNRVYILLHIYRHLFDEGIGLRQVIDYYYILQQDCSPQVKENSLRYIQDLGMTRFCAAVMYIMREFLGLEEKHLIMKPSEKDGQFLFEEIMKAGNFGQWDVRIKRQAQERPIHKYFRKIKRNLRFIGSYPNEVIWNPAFRLWHYFWRRKNGYL